MRSLVVNRCASIRDIVSMLEKQTQCKILHWFEKRRGGGGGVTCIYIAWRVVDMDPRGIQFRMMNGLT